MYLWNSVLGQCTKITLENAALNRTECFASFFSFHEHLLAFPMFCAVHCRKAWTCWTGLLSGGIQCRLHQGKINICRSFLSNHTVTVFQWRFHCVHQINRVCLKDMVTRRLLSSGYCCVLQDGRVVLGGPGSFYWQGELTRMWNSMDFQEISSNRFFL